MAFDIVRASFAHRWSARVAVTILKPLRRRITARAARERACRDTQMRSVRAARRVADASLRGGAVDALAVLARIRAARVATTARGVRAVVSRKFLVSRKAFAHAGFRFSGMVGKRVVQAPRRRAGSDARDEKAERAGNVVTLARRCVEAASSMLARERREGTRDAVRAQRAQAKARSAQRNDEDDEVVMLARKFFCTFFLTSPNKRIMIRLDKSLTSLHGLRGKQDSKMQR
ncbi:hypothetical protein [Cupriavidus sp. 8B]